MKTETTLQVGQDPLTVYLLRELAPEVGSVPGGPGSPLPAHGYSSLLALTRSLELASALATAIASALAIAITSALATAIASAIASALAAALATALTTAIASAIASALALS